MRRTLLPSVVVFALIAGCGSDDAGKEKAKTTGETATTADGEAARAPGPGCRAVPAPRAKGEQHLSKPSTRLDPNRTYTLELVTNCGTIGIRLATRRAPRTTASVAHLVQEGFYNGLTFHRIAHDQAGGDFVIQGGDPLGTGEGGPGYQVTEKPPADLRYKRGIVAMAKTELERPGTSGSQFFIVTAEDTPLPPDYALVGTVKSGDEVVSRIAAAKAGPPPGEAPRSPIVIERARLAVK